MEPISVEETTLDAILKLLSGRGEMCGTGVQSAVCSNVVSGRQNWLTKLEFLRNDDSAPVSRPTNITRSRL